MSFQDIFGACYGAEGWASYPKIPFKCYTNDWQRLIIPRGFLGWGRILPKWGGAVSGPTRKSATSLLCWYSATGLGRWRHVSWNFEVFSILEVFAVLFSSTRSVLRSLRPGRNAICSYRGFIQGHAKQKLGAHGLIPLNCLVQADGFHITSSFLIQRGSCTFSRTASFISGVRPQIRRTTS